MRIVLRWVTSWEVPVGALNWITPRQIEGCCLQQPSCGLERGCGTWSADLLRLNTFELVAVGLDGHPFELRVVEAVTKRAKISVPEPSFDMSIQFNRHSFLMTVDRNRLDPTVKVKIDKEDEDEDEDEMEDGDD
ncbi:hypothetical protein KSP40_PGU012498 [Platanthera guangdongensis]|uniref:Uncharacterized protein n=1 Tax=Platanthera guangdongensis TaxID=2320717 RepID=A0ABR2MUS2_9ASPA